MRVSVLACSVIFALSGGVAQAATQAGTLGVSATVVDRCAVTVRDDATADVRCDRGMPYRIERRPIVLQADSPVRTVGTVIIY